MVIDWCYTFCKHQRRHSAADGQSPVNYEVRESKTTRKRHRKPSTIAGEPFVAIALVRVGLEDMQGGDGPIGLV